MSSSPKIRAILIDDSTQARKLLRLMLHEMAPDFTIVCEAEDVDSSLLMIRQYNPDVLFLDIEMPGKSGLQLAEILLTENFKGNIVFTTAYNAYAIKAFRLSAIDYLLKPIQEEHLLEALDKLRAVKETADNNLRLTALEENLREERNEVLCIPNQNGTEYLQLEQIKYLEADGSYVKIHCINSSMRTVSKNLKYFETALTDCSAFIRPHRSFLVNIEFVTNYSKTDGGFLVLTDNVKIPVARERKHSILELLK